MALRFNPPPNWPAPPEGFEPPAGWQPDPAWGPAPEGWQIWVDDSVASSGSAASAAGAATEADPAWAPTQAVSTAPTAPVGTNASVADPTGMSASAPSGDYAAQTAGASPYAANMDYAQSPTPFQSQGALGGSQPPVGGWQPGGICGPGAPGGSKPVTQQWWFWTGAAVLVVVLAVSGIVWAMSGSDNGGDDKAGGTSTSQSKSGKSSNSGSNKGNKTTKTSGGSGGSSSGKGPGTKEDPIDPSSGPIEVKAGKTSTDPSATVEITFKPVEWNLSANTMKNGDKYASYEEPPAGQSYMRVPVDITYHGDGQLSSFDLNIDYSYNGTTSEEKSYILDKGALENQSMPRDGGTASGYLVFIADSSTQNDGNGVFVVSLGFGGDEVYVKAQ